MNRSGRAASAASSSCHAPPVRVHRAGLAPERLLQDGHLAAQFGQVAGPLRVRPGGEQNRAVDPGLVQQPHVRRDRVMDVAVRIDDH